MGRCFFVLAFLFIGVFLMAPDVLADDDAVLFIVLGQSNADGSGYVDAEEDARLRSWYEGRENRGMLKIWYRSCKVVNDERNVAGDAARRCVDGDTVDVGPGWLDLWYKNDNMNGRTAMQMIHGAGTYSLGEGAGVAENRRGMEGEFGKRFAEAFPNKELYVLKLGVSGSQISTWAEGKDGCNWRYFLENIYRPAMDDLLRRGKRVRLAGIWWMQGCGDYTRDAECYGECLREVLRQFKGELGFPDCKIYVGTVMGPGENEKYPAGSPQYGAGVRAAQEEVAASDMNVELVDTRDCSRQWEDAFSGYLHIDHKGQSMMGRILAGKVTEGEDNWAEYGPALR